MSQSYESVPRWLLDRDRKKQVLNIFRWEMVGKPSDRDDYKRGIMRATEMEKKLDPAILEETLPELVSEVLESPEELGGIFGESIMGDLSNLTRAIGIEGFMRINSVISDVILSDRGRGKLQYLLDNGMQAEYDDIGNLLTFVRGIANLGDTRPTKDIWD